MYKIISLILSSWMIIQSSDADIRSISNVRQLLQCASKYDYACVLDFMEDAVDNVYNNLLKEADADARKMESVTGRGKGEPPSSIITTITSILTELPELLKASLNSVLNGEDDNEDTKAAEEVEEDNKEEEGEEEEDDDEEGEESDEEENKPGLESKTLDDEKGKIDCKNASCALPKSAKIVTQRPVSSYSSNSSLATKRVGVSRKKKKKKQKLKAIIKFVIVAIVLIVKLNIFLKLLAAKLQIKFFLIAIVNLIITLARFWWDLKKGHNDHPQKVIYYEHAQHQHHYDGGDDWHSSGPGESYWGRSYEKVDDKKSAQDLAYSKQAPGSTTYSRIDDKPNFSWNPWAERSL